MRIEVTRTDTRTRPAGTTPGQICRGCRVALAEDEAGDGGCASCMAVVACRCRACDEVWTLPRVPDLWPPCPTCGRRDFDATTACARLEVSE